MGHVTWPRPFKGWFVIPGIGFTTINNLPTKFKVSVSTSYENMKGNASSSAITKGLHDALCELKSCQLQPHEKSNLKRLAVSKWTWLSLEAIVIATIRQDIHHLLLVVSGNNYTISRCFQDSHSTTASDLDKDLEFQKVCWHYKPLPLSDSYYV